MPSHARMIWAVFRRNFVSYFINPTGYVFITVFILLGAIAAFWRSAFFLSNLANLDTLNAFYPILLLFFVPALTMNVWSEERRLGTDELLFTMPGRDTDIVLGKYFAVLGIYTVAVLFSLSHLLILLWLGKPDLGLMFANYLGYWLSGAALLAVGMIASLLTANATVAFILGALFCSALVFFDMLPTMLGDVDVRVLELVGLRPQFATFGNGLITFSAVFYFVALAVIALYLNVALLSRRHIRGGERSLPHGLHVAVRTIALLVAGASLLLMVDRTSVAADVTAERLHTLQPQTRQLIDEIPEDRPVYIQAFLSEDVPGPLVQVRKNILNTLKRIDGLGGSRIELAIHDIEPYTELAAEVAENYEITPQRLFEYESGQRSSVDVYMGLVFTSGPEEFVIPFFDPGLPVEYELARSIRVVSRAERKTIGVVTTDAQIFGGFDFQTMVSRPDWSIINELRKQYDVQQVTPDGPYPDDLDALLVVLPSSLTQPQMDVLEEAIHSGTPTLLFDDPLPMFNPKLSPRLDKGATRNPFTQRNQPDPGTKGNFDGLLARLGLKWNRDRVIWSDTNPHPTLADAAPEILFITESSASEQPFNEQSLITAGLQEVVMLYSGALEQADGAGDGFAVTDLLRTGTDSGQVQWQDLVSMNLFGVNLNPSPRRVSTGQQYVTAMRVTGSPSGEQQQDAPPIDVIMVADADIVSELFFDFRRRGVAEFNFDNVTFALNCIDVLAGDESFVELRKHRPTHRTLTRLEQLTKGYEQQRRDEIEHAEARAQEQLDAAQQRLNEKVNELRQRDDLDEQAKRIMLANLQNVEQRRLSALETEIEQEKQQAIDHARTAMEQGVRTIQTRIKLWAALLPPIPALVLAIGMFAYRFKREKVSAAERHIDESGSS